MVSLTFLRRSFAYGLALLLCQALTACGSASAPQQSTNARAEPALPPLPDDAPLVIAFGDSLYAGYQLAPNEGLAPQLQAALRRSGRAVRVQNAGVSGDTTAAGRARLTFVLDNARQKPALVLVGLGGNDMLRGIGPAQTRANMAWMVKELRRRDIAVLITGMLATPSLGGDYSRDFNPIYPDLAKQSGAMLDPFLMDGVVGQPGLMLGDGLHPNAKGVAVIVDRLTPLVARALPFSATQSATDQ